jgi:hypothetical protein
MKYLSFAVIFFFASSLLPAQTPQVKWSQPSSVVSYWIHLNGQFYPYYVDNTKFLLYDRLSTTTKFQTSLPKGKIWAYAEGLSDYQGNASDVTGDNNQDILVQGTDKNGGGYYNNYVILDGATGNIVYTFLSSTTSYQLQFVSDCDGDGKNEIIMMQETTGDTIKWVWVVYATNGIATSINQNPQSPPAGFSLSQNYPNPFNPSTTISYTLPASELVILKLYDVAGREVRTLINRIESTGNHFVNLDASGLASGVYFYQLQSGGMVQAKKLVVIK